jgi:V8-like Glu-specific endopeptidase
MSSIWAATEAVDPELHPIADSYVHGRHNYDACRKLMQIGNDRVIPPREEGGPETQAFIPETLVTEGVDRRKLVQDSSVWPNRTIGFLSINFPGAREVPATGVLISPWHVLTAGHCVYDRRHGGWAEDITFDASRCEERRPYPTARAIAVFSPLEWTRGSGGDKEYDIAVIVLDRAIGISTGWCGIACCSDTTLDGAVVDDGRSNL